MKKLIVLVVVIAVIVYLLPNRKYTNDDFGIDTYYSQIDMDQDGIDDQSDVLSSVREYIATKPKYESKYYSSGYPNDDKGVCSDVVAFGLLGAGYDLMDLVNQHILSHRELYEIDVVDQNIDFRRVRNLNVFFKETAIILTCDIYDYEEWQGGDIVVFDGHIGIVSDQRNKKGIPYVIHHASPLQLHYEEDILEKRDDIIGHYRIS